MTKPPAGRSRLGRGLDALLSLTEQPVKVEIPASEAAADATAATPPVTPIPPRAATSAVADTPWQLLAVGQIVANPHQPRQAFSDESLAELAASLKANGLIQPIIVRKVGEQFELIAGERRLRAARLAGLTHIPVIVREVDPYTQAQLALVENIQREDLNPLDRANAYQSLMVQLGLTQAELASRLGEQRSSVANFLRLLELSQPVRELVRNGQLTLGHAKVLAGVTDASEQERLAMLCVSQQLSVRNLERLLEAPPPTDTPSKGAEPSAHLRELEQKLTHEIGLRVQLRSGANKTKGRVVIHYTSLEQFDELLKRLNIQLDSE